MSRISCRVWVATAVLLWYAPLVFAASNSGASTSAAAPTFPYVDRDGYHSVLTGRWKLTAPAAVVTGAGPNATTVASLPAGATVNALKVEIITLRPAICVVVKDGTFNVRQWIRSGDKITGEHVQSVSFRRGDKVYELGYYEEGECSIWIKGVTGIAECQINTLSGGPELCHYVEPKGVVNETWAYVQTTNGKRGWIRQPQAKGMSRHD